MAAHEGDPRPSSVRASAAWGLAMAAVVLMDVRGVSRAGWEAVGGVLVVLLAGATTLTWRVRPNLDASRRASSLAGLAGMAFGVGGLAHTSAPWPLIGLLALAVAAQGPAVSARAHLGSVALLVASVMAGFVFVQVSTVERAAQVGGAFALGAFLARGALDQGVARIPLLVAACVLGLGLASWALG